jgi:hypothetical protein
MSVALDDAGRPSREPARVPLAGDGQATAILLDGARALVVRSGKEELALDAIDLGGGKPHLLYVLDGPPSLDVAMAVTGEALFFNDEGTTAAERRVRRAVLGGRR